jgi:hypothetical protein
MVVRELTGEQSVGTSRALNHRGLERIVVGAEMKSHLNHSGSRDHLTNFGWPIPHG